MGSTHATPELLISELRRLTSPAGAIVLTFGKYSALGGSYSIGTFHKHFGSWRAAVEAIGYRDGHSGRYSDEELFSEMQRLWEAYGRQPTYKDMGRDGNISGEAFQNRFGSWMQAIYAFCADRQSVDDEITLVEEGPKVDPERLPPSTTLDQISSISENVVDVSPKIVLVDRLRVAGKRLRFQVFVRDKHRCVFCGRSAKIDGLVMHVNHIVPYSRGGLTVFENLQTTCEDCNVGKSDSVLEANW